MLIDDDVSRVKDLAEKVLRDSSCSRPPVNVNVVGLFDPTIAVRGADLRDRRGALFPNGQEWLILVNANDREWTQRFTIFHEGFHVLVRTGAVRLKSKGKPAIERLADIFAASVLMPEHWVWEEWMRLWNVRTMCRVFKVSPAAMTLRLKELGIPYTMPRDMFLDMAVGFRY